MNGQHRQKLITPASLAAGSFLLSYLLFWVFPSVFIPWNAQTTDALYRLRSNLPSLNVPYDSTIIHVSLSDKSLFNLPQQYLTRSDFARIASNVSTLGASAQFWDFIFPARDIGYHDSIFIDAVARAGNIYFGIAFLHVRQDEQGISEAARVHNASPDELEYLRSLAWDVGVEGDTSKLIRGYMKRTTLTELARASKALGSLSIDFDDDGVFRRVPLFLNVDGALHPTLAFRVICNYLGVTPENIHVHPGTAVTLMNARRPGGAPHTITIPVNERCEMIINYNGPWDSMRHDDFAEVYHLSDDMDLLESMEGLYAKKIVVVSQVTTGSADFGPVPTDNSFPLSGLHANVMNTILTERFIREMPATWMFIIEVLLVSILFFLSLKTTSKGFFIAAATVVVAYFFIAGGAFLYASVILNVLQPILGMIFTLFSILGYRYFNEEKERAILRRSFEAYFPPAIVKKIEANPELIYAQGQKKELTILFSDIKGFTNMSSTMAPDEVQHMLNEYFEEMVEVVFRYGGTVDKFIGDGLMVFFGDPEPQYDHAIRCVRCAIDMQKKMGELKQKWESAGRFGIAIRVGINTGFAIVGNMGSSKRLSYTVIGADVNLASRMESNAPVGGILITEKTYEKVREVIPCRSGGSIKVKGLDEPVPVFEVELEKV